jgi:hypothetical protein
MFKFEKLQILKVHEKSPHKAMENHAENKKASLAENKKPR